MSEVSFRNRQEALAATGRWQYGDPEVVATMPVGNGGDVKIEFFTLGRTVVNSNDLDKEYEQRGLKAADPLSLAATNEADPSFADTHPNCTYWRDANGRVCCASFLTHGDERRVVVDYYHSIAGYYYFAGIPK